MTYQTTHAEFSQEVAEALGVDIKDCKAIEVRIASNEIVLVRTEHYLRTENAVKLVEVLRRYKLQEKGRSTEITSLTDASGKWAYVE